MTPPRPTVAEVIRSCLDEFLETYGSQLTPEQRRTLKELTSCRTAALGGHVLGCPECGHQQIAYNSCGNRHCPTCQATAAARWLEKQSAHLLPTPYFHVVFTLPDALDPIALANPRVVYDLLLRSAAETVLEVAADPDHLGAQTGVLTVLHTWGQNLQFHPHVHGVVPGGGLSPDGPRWVASPRNFFLPVGVLSRVFRGKFLAGLRAALANGELRFAAARFERLGSAAVRTDWVVYIKPPFGSPEQVLKYLARYTHRVAISNARILDFKDGLVRFRYKDYAHGNRKRLMTLTALEFVRRLLLHVLPTGFVRIRHSGILSNRHRRQELELCRRLLESSQVAEPELESPEETKETRESPSSITPTRVCPVCGAGRMIVIREFPPMPVGPEARNGAGLSVDFDSSEPGVKDAVTLGSPNDRRARRSGDSLRRGGKTGETRQNRGVASDCGASVGRVESG